MGGGVRDHGDERDGGRIGELGDRRERHGEWGRVLAGGVYSNGSENTDAARDVVKEMLTLCEKSWPALVSHCQGSGNHVMGQAGKAQR